MGSDVLHSVSIKDSVVILNDACQSQLLLEVMEGFRKKSPVCFVISLQLFMGLDFTQQLKTYQSRSPVWGLQEKSTESMLQHLPVKTSLQLWLC